MPRCMAAFPVPRKGFPWGRPGPPVGDFKETQQKQSKRSYGNYCGPWSWFSTLPLDCDRPASFCPDFARPVGAGPAPRSRHLAPIKPHPRLLPTPARAAPPVLARARGHGGLHQIRAFLHQIMANIVESGFQDFGKNWRAHFMVNIAAAKVSWNFDE